MNFRFTITHPIGKLHERIDPILFLGSKVFDVGGTIGSSNDGCDDEKRDRMKGFDRLGPFQFAELFGLRSTTQIRCRCVGSAASAATQSVSSPISREDPIRR